jgi:hypothetical protein
VERFYADNRPCELVILTYFGTHLALLNYRDSCVSQKFMEVFMPKNKQQGNLGKGTLERDSQGQFTSDRDRSASNRGDTGRSSSGNKGNSSQSRQHMSEIGRKGGQH